MSVHSVKIHAPFFRLIATGEKLFEIRKNDRNYCEGDVVIAHEVKPGGADYKATGRRLTYVIGHMTDYEQRPGYVVWSVLDAEVIG